MGHWKIMIRIEERRKMNQIIYCNINHLVNLHRMIESVLKSNGSLWNNWLRFLFAIIHTKRTTTTTITIKQFRLNSHRSHDFQLIHHKYLHKSWTAFGWSVWLYVKSVHSYKLNFKTIIIMFRNSLLCNSIFVSVSEMTKFLQNHQK